MKQKPIKQKFELTDGKLILPAAEALGKLPSWTQLFNNKHGSRHPQGIYAVSLAEIFANFGQVLDLLEDTSAIFQCVSPDSSSTWDREMLRAYDTLLDSLMQHFDDCDSIILCFFQYSRERKSSEVARRFEKDTDWYRDTLGRTDNHIKHHQGRLRFAAMRNEMEAVPGYFVEGVNEEGSLGPTNKVHGKAVGAFSFYRDLRVHLVGLCATSQALQSAILGLTTQPMEGAQTRAFTEPATDIFRRISALPRRAFGIELALDWPRVNFCPPSNAGSGSASVEYPSLSERPTELKGRCHEICKFEGDGVTKSFGFPFLSKP